MVEKNGGNAIVIPAISTTKTDLVVPLCYN